MKPFAWIDVETTGLDPARHEILEIAVLREAPDLDLTPGSTLGHISVEGAKKRKSLVFHSLVKPQNIETAEVKALEINGYAQAPEKWATAPSLDEVFPHVLRLLDGAILAGHNIAFDKEFIAAAGRRAKSVVLPARPPWNYHSLDTVTLCLEHLPTLHSPKLTFACSVLGLLEDEPDHRALSDARKTQALYWTLARANPLDRWRWKKRITQMGLDRREAR